MKLTLSKENLRECVNCGRRDLKLRPFDNDLLCFECAKELLDPEDFREYLESNK